MFVLKDLVHVFEIILLLNRCLPWQVPKQRVNDYDKEDKIKLKNSV